jgi:hypothetical protein
VSLNPTDAVRRLRVAGYYVGSVILIAHVAELFLYTWPARVHSPTWRLSFVGATANTVFMTLLVLFILVSISVFAADRRVAFALAGVTALGGLLFVGLTGMFVLDALQMRNQVRQPVAGQYDYSAAWVFGRELVGVGGFFLLTVAALRSARGLQAQVTRSQRNSALIVGAMPTPRTEKAPVAPRA